MSVPAIEPSAEFLVLGPLGIVHGGAPVHVTAGRPQVVLSMLLLEAGRVVSVQRLLDALWADEPPTTARSQVQICISALRRLLTGTGADILTQPPGYLLRIPDGALDLVRFRDLCARAESLAPTRPEEAVARYREALSLWRGDACASVDSQVVAQAAIRLNEERWTALERRMDLELRLGRHQEVAGELAEIVSAEPFRERPRALLMLALYRSGRQAEALEAYRSGRKLLVEELGTDPGRELRGLEQAILNGDASLDAPVPETLMSSGDASASTNASAAPALVPLPRQLPASVPDFVGRDGLVKLARKVLQQPGDSAGEPGAVPVVLLTGRGGTGKTTLALSIAHAIRDDFADGQLFARLRESGGSAASPAAVLEHFLLSLGVSAAAVPGPVEARTAMFRSCLAGRRVLIVLDDVATVGQIEPLLPGDAGCGVIVTSRSRPAPPGAIHLEVGDLDQQASAELLQRVVGPERIAAEREAAAELIRLCEGLPLALRIVASKLRNRRHWRVRQMVERLRDEQNRLNELDLEGVNIRATLEFSYRSISDSSQMLLSRLGLLHQTEFPAWISVPLLDMPPGPAEEVLEDLVTVGLVEAQVAEGGDVRYRIHEMIRIFAREKLAKTSHGNERLEPLIRYLGCWLSLIGQAHRKVYGGDFHVVHGTAPLWSPPDWAVADMLANPMAWFRAEGSGLIEAVLLAARAKLDELCWDLAVTAVAFFELGGFHDQWYETHEAALSVTRETGNDRGTAALLHSLGLRATARDVEQARDYLHQSLEMWQRVGDPHGTALALVAMANIDRLRGELDAAAMGYDQALQRFRESGDPAGEASALRGLGQVATERGACDEGLELLERSICVAQEAGARRDAAQSMYYAAELLIQRGDLDQAELRLRQVAHATRESSDIVGEGYALLGLGSVHMRSGRPTQASNDLCEAETLAVQAGDGLLRARVLLASADNALANGSLAAARSTLAAARETLSAIGSPPLWRAKAAELERQIES